MHVVFHPERGRHSYASFFWEMESFIVLLRVSLDSKYHSSWLRRHHGCGMER